MSGNFLKLKKKLDEEVAKAFTIPKEVLTGERTYARYHEYGTRIRQMSKSWFQEQMIAVYVRANPNAVVARISRHGTIIEKPVIGGSHEIIEPKQLGVKDETGD